MIEVVHVRKTFGNLVAVDDVGFEVNRGEIFGLLGPNGAGKTTTLRMLYGLIKPSGGHLRVAGIDVTQRPLDAQRRLGVLPDGGGLYNRLTARENIAYFGALQGMTHQQIKTRTEELAEKLSMHNLLERKTRGFSQGERMKVGLARALVHDPDYLLLDEPTNGLDVLTTRAVRQLLLQLKAAGKSIVFSSHLMHEVAQLCDRVAIVAKGRIAVQGAVDEVQQQARAETMEDAFIHFAYDPDDAHV
jgi:sodium transport system ATP-binding protein